jgi:hypothetical protein
MTLSKQEIDDWADAYIRYQTDSARKRDDDPNWWAVQKFFDGMQSETAEDCWVAILAILDREPADAVLGILAAGPLEDLIHHDGARFIDRIELQARRDPAFRHLLGGVWESGPEEIWTRVDKARGKAW